mgnify:CR=1 FL=1
MKNSRGGGRFILFEQTGRVRRGGASWCRRHTSEYREKAAGCGFELERAVLVAFPEHWFICGKIIFPVVKRLFLRGKSSIEAGIVMNRSLIMRAISNMALKMTSAPLKDDNGTHDGNTLYIFRKKCSG